MVNGTGIPTNVKQERETRGYITRIAIALEKMANAFIAVTSLNYSKVFTATGASNTFTLTPTPAAGLSEPYIYVSVEGAEQDPTSNYTYAANAITITGALLPAGTKVYVRWPV